MIRLTQVCLIVFLATLGLWLYQLHNHTDYGLSFLLMGATGCLYLLLAFEKYFTERNHNLGSTLPRRPENIKRVEPACAVSSHFAEHKKMPSLITVKIEQRR